MTAETNILIQEAGTLVRFPEFPPRDDMQNTSHLHLRSVLTSLAIHFDPRPNTLIHSEVPVAPTLNPWGRYRIPDLIVAFGCDIALVYEQRGYAIDAQGKPPDFALEVASVSTGVVDYTDKRAEYERYGVREYWRYDPSGGQYHDAALAADKLVDGLYKPIEIEWLDADRCRGYSEVLGLYVCWEYGELRFWDPATEVYIKTHQDDVARAEAEAKARREAEARNAELEAELRRLRG